MNYHYSDPTTIPHGNAFPRCNRSASGGIKSTPHHRTIVFVVALMVGTIAMASHGSINAVAADLSVPAEGRVGSLTSDNFANIVGRQFEMRRRLETTVNQHFFEDGREDNDHNEVTTAVVVEQANEDHDDHGYSDLSDDIVSPTSESFANVFGRQFEITMRRLEITSEEEDVHLFDDGHEVATAIAEEDHEDHDHGEVANIAAGEENHEGHDHGDDDHDEEDDHAGHDHGDEELVSSTTESLKEKLPWGPVIGASLIVNLAALSGVLVVVMTAIQRGVLEHKGKDASDTVVGHGRLFDICIPAFAVGALIATAVFLIFPEAVHLIEGGSRDGDEHDHRYLQEDNHEGHDDSSESTNAAKFGCAVLGGFLLPFLFSIFFNYDENVETATATSASMEADELCASCQEKDIEIGVAVVTKATDSSSRQTEPPSTIVQKIREDEPVETIRDEEQSVVSRQNPLPLISKNVVNKQLCASILLGDGFHNFADGIFLGAAFKSCSAGTALSIVLVTLFHEMAQELADFVLLTRYAGLSIINACVLNFLSGLTVCLGGIVFLALDPSDQATGIILAMAGGVYFNIAGCETIPRIKNAVKGRIDRVWTLFSAIVGTIPIGLILLNHQHC
mmetsp:Transcript_42775/g.89717  ORF Transcript_42775/g.89717 Transcript_42775/m.89717 type:complete len:620 (-) Transcript_42775:74-1933(-)